MVRLAQSGDHFPFDEASAMGTLGAETLLVVSRAVVVAFLAEEAALRERRLAHVALEALDVEVFVLYAQHLARTLLLAALAMRLPCFFSVFVKEKKK